MMTIPAPTTEQDFLRRAIQRSEKALAHAQSTLVAVATRLANQRRELRRCSAGLRACCTAGFQPAHTSTKEAA